MADASAPHNSVMGYYSLKLDPGNQYHCLLTFSPRPFSLNFHLHIGGGGGVRLLCGTPVAVVCVEMLNKLAIRPPVGRSLELPWGHRALVWTAVWL